MKFIGEILAPNPLFTNGIAHRITLEIERYKE
jgi:hypothetical protein